ncbi:hypothetical protein GCM10020216_066110 [Nonomuraea helvata]
MLRRTDPGLQRPDPPLPLNRAGDRDATHVLYIIALNRLAHDERSRAYAARRTGEGFSKKDILRCLKRYIARDVYRIVTRGNAPVPSPPPALDRT